MGNQCGCQTTAFMNTPVEYPHKARHDLRPAARLVEALHGRTLCLVGDSVDYQFFTAIKKALHRVHLKTADSVCKTSISTIEERAAPASCLNLTLIKWWGAFTTLMEVDVLDKTGARLARVRVFKFYNNEHALYDMVERYCDVVSLHMGVHWSSGPTSWQGRDAKDFYPLAVESGAAFLANLSAGGKVAMWRSTTPQHFPTPTGAYAKRTNHCQPFVQKCPQQEQSYNTAARRVLERMVRAEDPLPPANAKAWAAELLADPCDLNGPLDMPAAYTMTVNQSRGFAQSRFHFWEKSNNTAPIVRERDRVTHGTVYWWAVWDIFNPHWLFHVGDSDCTHSCYVPGVYDAAIERLTTILAADNAKRPTPAVSTALDLWKCPHFNASTSSTTHAVRRDCHHDTVHTFKDRTFTLR
jgi:hypothetical protein